MIIDYIHEPSCSIHHLASEKYSAYEKNSHKLQKTRGNYGIFLNFERRHDWK
jgi:hypothetical protein